MTNVIVFFGSIFIYFCQNFELAIQFPYHVFDRTEHKLSDLQQDFNISQDRQTQVKLNFRNIGSHAWTRQILWYKN